MTGRAFEDLQKRCKKMGIRKFLKSTFYLFIFLIFLAFSYFVFIKIDQKDSVKNEAKQEKAKALEKKATDTVLKKKNPTKAKKISKPMVRKDDYNTVVLKPTIVIPKVDILEKKKKADIKPQIVEETTQKKEKNPPKVEEKKKKIFIQVRSLEDEESLLRENRANEDFDTTLKLATYYFGESKFEKAITWSKKANHYNPSSFKPWLIYAKAKIKQSKKEEAIKAVETFLSYFTSVDAQKYLLSIKGDK